MRWIELQMQYGVAGVRQRGKKKRKENQKPTESQKQQQLYNEGSIVLAVHNCTIQYKLSLLRLILTTPVHILPLHSPLTSNPAPLRAPNLHFLAPNCPPLAVPDFFSIELCLPVSAFHLNGPRRKQR